MDRRHFLQGAAIIGLTSKIPIDAQSAKAGKDSREGSGSAKSASAAQPSQHNLSGGDKAALSAAPELTSPFYITPRPGAQHIGLESGWQLSYRDSQISTVADLQAQEKWLTVESPMSVQMALYHAGELPHPYYHLNSEKYKWVDEKVWYYRRSFTLPASGREKYVYLVFDGIDYFARVWLNGELLGEHEGMFGGPAVEISGKARFDATNEVVVEVRAANWGNKKNFNSWNPGKIIMPWVLLGGIGAEMFFPLGMWRGARIEILPSLHLERPHFSTESLTLQEARLKLKVEVLANLDSLKVSLNPKQNVMLSIYRDPSSSKKVESNVEIEVSLLDKKSGTVESVTHVPAKVWNGRNWIEKDITLSHPKPWWPIGMGEQHLYVVRLRLQSNGQTLDTLEWDFGIRTLETVATPGPQTLDRWANWQFVVNGRKLFVKGMNWMPADILLDLPAERYRWLLSAARNAGIQLVRVWGGGLIETEEFYAAANELGILVWQDFPIGNVTTPDWPQSLWEALVVQNIFRLRNHPSLALYCGGNEFNPYVDGNAAAVGILERSFHDFDPGRPYRRTTPDAGSVHAYLDIDPTWFGKIYSLVPYISETGIHSFPEPDMFREVGDPNEFSKPLSNLLGDDFKNRFPEFSRHFIELDGSYVPKMFSRASHIDDLSAPTLETLSEAVQIGTGEFYLVLSEALQANYPITSGLMPWVLSRPWPAVAMQFIDGLGQPVAPYYFLKRSYEATHVSVQLPSLLWRTGEAIPIKATVTHSHADSMSGLILSIDVLDDGFHPLWHKQSSLSIVPGPSVTSRDLGSYSIPEDYRDRFLIIVSELRTTAGKLVSRSVYWPRVLSLLSDSAEFKKYRTSLAPWPESHKGPWLKPTVSKTRTMLSIKIVSAEVNSEGNQQIKVLIRNAGKAPSFMTHLDIRGARRTFFGDDNYFWMGPGEIRDLSFIVHWRERCKASDAVVKASAWNANEVEARFLPTSIG